jgi:hypothetical protein
MNGCRHLLQTFMCWSSRVSVSLCTGACSCNFPVRPTTAPTTTTPTTTSSTATTTPIPPPKCTLSIKQAPAWLTTLQLQPPVDRNFEDKNGVPFPFNRANPRNLTRFFPWVRPSDQVRRLLLTTIGASSAPMPASLNWSDLPDPAILFVEDAAGASPVFVTATELTAEAAYATIFTDVDRAIKPLAGAASQGWTYNGTRVNMFNQSTLANRLYVFGSRCDHLHEASPTRRSSASNYMLALHTGFFVQRYIWRRMVRLYISGRGEVSQARNMP